MHIYLFELISSWTDIRDVVRPTVPVVLKDFLLWLEKRDGNCIFSVEGLDFRKYLQGKQKLNVIRKKNPQKPQIPNKKHFPMTSIQNWEKFKYCYYRPGRRRSLISMLKKGRNKLPQKGHVVLRFESSAVQPAMISSSWTKQSQVRHREQLEMRTCTEQEQNPLEHVLKATFLSQST